MWELGFSISVFGVGCRNQSSSFRVQNVGIGFQACTPRVVPPGLGIRLRDSRGLHWPTQGLH